MLQKANPAHLAGAAENWVLESTGWEKEWTAEENKVFEKALAIVDTGCPDRWQKVTSFLPNRTPEEVMAHFADLEDDVTHIDAGFVSLPGYHHRSFQWNACFTNRAMSSKPVRKPSWEPERKKGVPWSEEEHRKFLMGLNKYGKGDWRNISRNLVTTRTPTQVASHAQKYFIRLRSGKDKQRPSIHDITVVNLADHVDSSLPPLPPAPLAPALYGAAVSGGGDEWSCLFLQS